jgi:CHASE2 domain-containing sensor protein
MNNIHFTCHLALVAGLAAGVAGLGADVGTLVDRALHARYAGLFADESRTQSVLLVAVDAATFEAWGPAPWTGDRSEALVSALEAATPRLIVWPEEDATLAGPRVADGSTMGIDPLIGPPLTRATDPGFPGAALQALGFPQRHGPLPAHYVSFLPMVSAHRVAAGDIPPATFHNRVVIVGRTDRAVATVATPLGPMSPAQVEAHALLGVLDGAAWNVLPAWLRNGAFAAWALGLARALRGRSVAAIVGIAAVACGVAALVDVGLFAAGVARVGIGSAVLIAVAAVVAQLVLPSPAALRRAWRRRRLRERADAMLAAASTASGVRRWSDA